MSIAEQATGITVSRETIAKVIEFLLAHIGAIRSSEQFEELGDHLGWRSDVDAWDDLTSMKEQGLLTLSDESFTVRLTTAGWEYAKTLECWGDPELTETLQAARLAVAGALQAKDGYRFTGSPANVWQFVLRGQTVLSKHAQLLGIIALARTEGMWLELLTDGQTQTLEYRPQNFPAVAIAQGEAAQENPVVTAARAAIKDAITLARALQVPDQPPENWSAQTSPGLAVTDYVRLRILLYVILQGGSTIRYDVKSIAQAADIPEAKCGGSLRTLEKEGLLYLATAYHARRLTLLSQGVLTFVTLVSNESLSLRLLSNATRRQEIAAALAKVGATAAEANQAPQPGADHAALAERATVPVNPEPFTPDPLAVITFLTQVPDRSTLPLRAVDRPKAHPPSGTMVWLFISWLAQHEGAIHNGQLTEVSSQLGIDPRVLDETLLNLEYLGALGHDPDGALMYWLTEPGKALALEVAIAVSDGNLGQYELPNLDRKALAIRILRHPAVQDALCRAAPEAPGDMKLDEKIAFVRSLAINSEKGDDDAVSPADLAKVRVEAILHSLWELAQAGGRVENETMLAWSTRVGLTSEVHALNVITWLAHWRFIERIARGSNRAFWLTAAGADLLVDLLKHEHAGTLNRVKLPGLKLGDREKEVRPSGPCHLGTSQSLFEALSLKDPPQGWRPGLASHGASPVLVADALLIGDWLAHESPEHAHTRTLAAKRSATPLAKRTPSMPR
jgi:hypothetical protein